LTKWNKTCTIPPFPIVRNPDLRRGAALSQPWQAGPVPHGGTDRPLRIAPAKSLSSFPVFFGFPEGEQTLRKAKALI
jgi:hypothetical protein